MIHHLVRFAVAGIQAVVLVLVLNGPASADNNTDSNLEGDDEGFVSIDREALPTVSGEGLMMTAYGVIFFVFLAYGTSLLARERRIARRLEQIERQIHLNE